MNKTRERESGIELLRIIAIMGVILLHYNDGRAFKYITAGSIQEYILFFLESVAICAVDLFIMISGYFLSASQKRSLRKPFDLFFQLVVFHEVISFIHSFICQSFSIRGFVVNLIPRNYFVILYCALYLISPFINCTLRQLNNDQWKILIITSICVFSIWNTFIDLFEEILGKEIVGISSISIYGSIQGFNIANFCLAYIIGAWFRYGHIPKCMNSKSKLLLCWLATVVIIFLWSILTLNLTHLELRSAWVYHNPFVLLSAALLLRLFLMIHFHSRIINRLAGASFTCFILHSIFLGKVGIQDAVGRTPILMIMHIIIVQVMIYTICWIVFEIYDRIYNVIMIKANDLPVFKSWSIDV